MRISEVMRATGQMDPELARKVDDSWFEIVCPKCNTAYRLDVAEISEEGDQTTYACPKDKTVLATASPAGFQVKGNGMAMHVPATHTNGN
jgi:hypothetical protein